MAGVGRCRNCGSGIFWGSNPDGSGRPFPFDDPTYLTPHFSTCSAEPRVRDPWTGDEVRVSRCGFCKLSIWWQDTARHKRRPMNIQPDGQASQQCHLDTCSGSPRRAPWTGQGWTEPDPVFKVSTAPTWQTELQSHLAVLELCWPCSKKDVMKAFRKLALVRHPDHGGSETAFIQLKSAHDAAAELLERLMPNGSVPMS